MTEVRGISDEVVEALARSLVEETFGSKYQGPEGWERYQRERPNELVVYLERARSLLATSLPRIRDAVLEEIGERLEQEQSRLEAESIGERRMGNISLSMAKAEGLAEFDTVLKGESRE